MFEPIWFMKEARKQEMQIMLWVSASSILIKQVTNKKENWASCRGLAGNVSVSHHDDHGGNNGRSGKIENNSDGYYRQATTLYITLLPPWMFELK